MSFGQHLRRLREDAGLSRPELARAAGVPVSTLRNWEGDRGFPGLPVLVRLARTLGVPVERFAEGVADPEEDEPAAPKGSAAEETPTGEKAQAPSAKKRTRKRKGV